MTDDARRSRAAFLRAWRFSTGCEAALASILFYVLLGNYIGIGALSYEFGFSPSGWCCARC